ncbi:hypothetical protein CLOM_g13909 [Closterium sp. NIES-68]|nr:hypothetical protein CLOM_g13909 [Closterium sp. NIES-68]GJP76781.1 hypothetical protein CLOP_g7242 [Closterium sp. NIES-67]
MAVESLATLCVVSLIDHRDLLGDLGDMDLSLLRPVFEHCTADQLDRIENENKDRDFTPFTDDLWQRCYERRYGNDSVQQVQDRMRQAKVLYTWRQLYHARQQADDRTQQKCVSRLKELYHQADEVKKQRQLRVLEKPRLSVTRRRMFSSASSSQAAAWADRAGSSILKKARLGYANSFQARLVSDIKKKPLNYSPPRSYTHGPASLSSSPAARTTSRATVNGPAVTRQSSTGKAFSTQASANHSPQPRLPSRPSSSGWGVSEPPTAMRAEARGQPRKQVQEQARASSTAAILNIVDQRGGSRSAEGPGGSSKEGYRERGGGSERRMNSVTDWEWKSIGGGGGGDRGGDRDRDRDIDRDRVFDRGGDRGYDRDRDAGKGKDGGRVGAAGRKSSYEHPGSNDHTSKEKGAGGSTKKRKEACSMDWGV